MHGCLRRLPSLTDLLALSPESSLPIITEALSATSVVVRPVPTSSPFLRKLTILECACTSLCAAALARLPRALGSAESPLRVLRLRDAPQLTDEHVSSLLACCRALEALDVRSVHSRAREYRGAFLLGGHDRLTSLRVDGAHIGNAPQPPALPTPSQLLPQALLGATSLAASALAALGMGRVLHGGASTRPPAPACQGVGFPSLAQLDLSGGCHLTAEFVCGVLKGMPDLEALELASTGREQLGAAPQPARGDTAGEPASSSPRSPLVSSRLPALRTLRLGRVWLGADGVAAPLAEHCPGLIELHCVLCGGFDASFAAALHAISSLDRVRLSDCKHVSDDLSLALSMLPERIVIDIDPSTRPRRAAGRLDREASVQVRADPSSGGRSPIAASGFEADASSPCSTSSSLERCRADDLARWRGWVAAAIRCDPAAAALWEDGYAT